MSAEQIWQELRLQRERPIFRRVNESHPYDIYLGIDANDAPVLMLLSSHCLAQVPQLKALQVLQNVRNDGKFALVVTLENHELLHPFRYVCDDLVDSLRGYAVSGTEAAFLLKRLEKWRRLLESSKRGLSHAELVGFIGELLFLEKLAQEIGMPAALEAWLGPSGAPQDFQSSGHIYEIKVCAIGGHTVTISSLEQLHTGSALTTLIVYFIGSAAAGSTGAFSLNQLVNRVRSAAETAGVASILELKLAEVGYDEKQNEADSAFVVQQVKAFDIRKGFPRLTPICVAAAITSATYCIGLDSCVEFEVPVPKVSGHES